jgi:adenosylhomocysteine nucleosidase
MDTIGLIAAMTQESNALLRYVKPWKRIPVGSLRGNCFSFNGQPCVLVTSGMGILRAREAARCLVEIAPLRMLISFGIAGAVEADLQIGDVVLPEAFCRLEKGGIGSLLPLKPWPDEVREAVTQALARQERRLWIGTAVTTAGSQVGINQLGEMRHPILEMETAGIAQVAMEKNIPLLALRSISDGPSAPLPFDLGEMMDEDSNLHAGRLLRAIRHNPGIIFDSRQMIRNTRIAANNAAIALIAALSKAEFGQIQGKSND